MTPCVFPAVPSWRLVDLVPLRIDVIKTRIQVDPVFKGQSMLKTGRAIVGREGASALLTGFGPTAWGYLVQGGGKFAGYEFFKCQLVRQAGGYEAAVPNRTAIYLASARFLRNSTFPF
jgi:solute carrier family 25 (mitochondrial phosphate transporter), member 3